MSQFKLINSLKVNDEIPVNKYVSTETGIQVYIAQVHSPVTSAYLALGEHFKNLQVSRNENFLFAATEADSDDGIPHTLEHLIFLGSEEYPYKGVLDLLANRCLASGTSKLHTHITKRID